MTCDEEFFGICLMQATGNLGSSIFGFSEFIGALALLVIVYTIAGVRYRFRIAVAPFRLPRLTFYLIGVIGFGTLVTDVWISEGWPVVPVTFMSQSVVQGAFAATFLVLAMAWIYFAFINPPIFSKRNYQMYAQALFRAILKGSETELPVIAHELARSANAIVTLYSKRTKNQRPKDENDEETKTRKPAVGDYAADVMLLIGNRKLCRHIVASSPVTAIEFFGSAADNSAYHVPLGQFAKNISTEAIINTDSILYHEDDGFRSGLIGYLKPFSQAVYGNYRLVEGLGNYHGSPLDVDYKVVSSWEASQLEAYSGAVTITFADRLKSNYWQEHSYSLHRAFDNIESSCRDVYKLNNVTDGDPDISRKLRVAVGFAERILDLIDKQKNITPAAMRPNKDRLRRDMYDRIAEFMLELILTVSAVTNPQWECWHLQHNTVWTRFFDHREDSKARRIVQYKLRRMLYDEIRLFDKFENYKSARLLGICLNVMGVKIHDRKIRVRSDGPLHAAIIEWLKKNYLALRASHPDIADACLMGGISFDEVNKRLVRTYAKNLHNVAPQDYLQL